MNFCPTWSARVRDLLVLKLLPRLDGLGLLALRLFAGQEFVLAGYTKLAGGGGAPEWFAGLDFPFPLHYLGVDFNWWAAGLGEMVLGIALVSVSGWLWLDAVVAIAVALNILREGTRLIWRSSRGLMDESLEPQLRHQIDEVLAGFAHHRAGAVIVRFDHVSTRRAGQRRFVSLHMHMPAGWTLGRAAALRTSVEQALMSAVPGLRATIELLPSDVEAHLDDPREAR